MSRGRIPPSTQGPKFGRGECQPGRRIRNSAIVVALIAAASTVLGALLSRPSANDATEAAPAPTPAPAPTVTVTVTVTQQPPPVTGRVRSGASAGSDEGAGTVSSAEAVVGPALTPSSAP